MKRVWMLFIGMLIAFSTVISIPANAYSASEGFQASINVNGERIETAVTPFVKDGSTLVPLRGVVEKLGGQVEWIGSERKIIVTFNGDIIQLQIDNHEAMVNELVKTLEVAPMIYMDTTMIPLRFVAESMGMQVGWIPEARLATVTNPIYFSMLPENMVLGFTTNDYRGDNSPHNSFVKYYENIGSVATFSYKVDANGNLSTMGESQSDTVEFARAKGIKPLALIHNLGSNGFDINVSHAVLTDETKRSNLVNNILITLSKEKFAGVNIDIENIYWYDRPYYTALIKELKEKLAPYGFLTTASIPAKTYDSYAGNNWAGAFDYAEIGKYADKILVMTYDQHYLTDKAGPVASLPWVENVVRYARSVIPSDKILLGISAYGYDWPENGKGKTVKYKNAESLAASMSATPQWDESMKSPYFTYTKDGINHEVWYENAVSLAAKYELVDKYNLGGIGIWKLGFDDDGFWNVVRENLY